MLRQYDLKRIVIPSGSTECEPFANSPGASGGLLFVPTGWTGGASLAWHLSRKDFRIRHLSHTAGAGETSEAQLQVPEGPIVETDGTAVVTVPVAGSWIDVPEPVMKAPGVKLAFTTTSRIETLWIAQKA